MRVAAHAPRKKRSYLEQSLKQIKYVNKYQRQAQTLVNPNPQKSPEYFKGSDLLEEEYSKNADGTLNPPLSSKGLPPDFKQ